MPSPTSDHAEAPAAGLEALVEALLDEMRQRWQAGERPLVEEFLARHPELGDHPEAAAELIYEEVCLRQEYRVGGTGSDVVRRFPQWREPLRVLFNFHRLLGDGGPPAFPAAGESLGEFDLLAELGRGAHGRVYLASQPALAGRPVVLKLAPLAGREHLSLARLQHTHIVPLYAAQDYPERNLRALCMPYFGGITLAQALAALGDEQPARRTGHDLLRALQEAQAAAPVALPVAGRGCQFLARATFAQAVCWVGAALADALQYAEDRGLIHLDIKPSNVLLGADGQPMLLDFHLARGPLAAGTAAPAWLGGTPAHMPPEQRQALAAVRAGTEVPAAVDGRADVYALGLLLYELLGGPIPLPPSPMGRLRRANPEVTVGLSDVLRKCLSEDPADRYPGGAALAADLRRHLADLPLAGVANRSLPERWEKWRRRRPVALPLTALAAVLLGAAGAGAVYVAGRLERAEAALKHGRFLLEKHHALREKQLGGVEAGDAFASLEKGLALAEGLPFSGTLTRELHAELRQAREARAEQQLHALAERIRLLHGAEGLAEGEAKGLELQCREFWEKRELIVRRLGVERDRAVREAVGNDLLDLAILWGDLRARFVTGRLADRAHMAALIVLEQAEGLYEPSCMLYHARAVHATALGQDEAARAAARRAAELPPRTAWEHDALGRALAREGKLQPALEHYERAVELKPNFLWPHFHKGQALFQLGRYDGAVQAFTVCLALAPESAWCFYNRGLANARLGRFELAMKDYDRALEFPRPPAAAAVNRGMLHYEQQSHDRAMADLDRALDLGAEPQTVYYDLALVHAARGDRTAALTAVGEALRLNPRHADARRLQERLSER
jgi:serine/threonine protein kinase/Flp pilus assembly protein TadD